MKKINYNEAFELTKFKGFFYLKPNYDNE